MFFNGGINVGEGANRTGNCTGRDFLAGCQQPVAVTGELGMEAGEFQAHRHRLGVDAVAATHADHIPGFISALFQSFQYPVDILQKNIRGLRKLD